MLTITGLPQNPSSFSADLTAVFLQPQDLLATPAGLPAFESQQAEKGKKALVYHEGRPYLILGMGESSSLEQLRKLTHQAMVFAGEYQYKSLAIWCDTDSIGWQAITEAADLSMYRFTPYFNQVPEAFPQNLYLIGANDCVEGIEMARSRAEATNIARDLVNEPPNTLTATEFSQRMFKCGKTYGFRVEVFDKAKITELKMGGLLAVNLGSPEPPTFTVMEHAPAGTEQDDPIVLVGKGVVYDTGGLSLKPTANSMDFMKSDMAGAAAVVGTVCGLAKLNVPRRVVGLVPATDNRPGLNAFAPGDVIRMYDNSTVEVLNTDAEGRMILADALAYAKQYKPSLVIDLATLTGAQVVAIGSPGSALMSTASAEVEKQLVESGEATYERVVQLPLWEEYGEMLKSDIADIKNLGPSEAGCITAGKFLQHFIDYPWMHLDIAAPSFLKAPQGYRPKGGTGYGVRLLIDFISKLGEL